MSKYVIEGGRPLYGEISVQGAKNSVLPILSASLLTEERVVIHNVPRLKDVENMLKIITHPLCMGGSDGNALPASAKNSSHPRAFGAIAKFIRINLDHGESIGCTINKVTASPAQFFSLKENGLIRNGKKADLCVFLPEEIDSKADFTSPCRLADGIRLTMLDGKIEYYF